MAYLAFASLSTLRILHSYGNDAKVGMGWFLMKKEKLSVKKSFSSLNTVVVYLQSAQ
jgi:hypothetical protein